MQTNWRMSYILKNHTSSDILVTPSWVELVALWHSKMESWKIRTRMPKLNLLSAIMRRSCSIIPIHVMFPRIGTHLLANINQYWQFMGYFLHDFGMLYQFKSDYIHIEYHIYLSFIFSYSNSTTSPIYLGVYMVV